MRRIESTRLGRQARRVLLASAACVLLGSGCSGGSSGSSGDPGAFAGSYAGLFSGDDNGHFEVTLDESGNLSGGGTSVTHGDFTISGSVDGAGRLSGVASTGATWTGRIDSDEEIHGTWSNGTSSGGFGGSRPGVFANAYRGLYYGDDVGSFVFVISIYGDLVGTVTDPENKDADLAIEGTVDASGELEASVEETGATWSGTVDEAGDVGGTWHYASESGTCRTRSGTVFACGSFSGSSQ